MSGKREFGDYQTPLEFSGIICDYLRNRKGVRPSVVLEPTCGMGNFIKSSLSFNAGRYYGIEINPLYCDYAREHVSDSRVTIINDNFFAFSARKLLPDISNVLVIGNPPWATNSTLSALGSDNLPIKSNFKGMKGIDALTGASNFDICEFMILHMLHEFRETNTVIVMLCKTSVARNIFRELKRNDVCFEYCELLEFDANKVFGINANACALIVKLSREPCGADVCRVYSLENNGELKYSFGYRDGQFYSNVHSSACNFDGKCCLEWRQGVKHDCAKVMELTSKGGNFYNGRKEIVDIEDALVFPLVKSSMFKKAVIADFSKFVIVTQKKARSDTSYIADIAPKTWKYLNDNAELFRRRKSSIYRNAPCFSMFGVGDYSYSMYKVGISGFYKKPLFALLCSGDGKPVMTDDTSYFICFDDYDMAYTAMLLLNSVPVQDFLLSIVFLDAKRPYTKKCWND